MPKKNFKSHKKSPGGRPPGDFLSLNMDVIVDMLRAVAVVAVALGAVAELFVGIVGIGLSAYRALVDIAAGLLGVLGGLLEIHRLPGSPVGGLPFDPAQAGHQIVPEEDQIVQDGHDGGHHAYQRKDTHGKGHDQTFQNGVGKQSRIQPGQPLDLDGNDKEEKHLQIRIQRGKGEKE